MIGKTPYEILTDAHENLVAENARLRTDIERLHRELATANDAASEGEHLRIFLKKERARAQDAEKLLAIQSKISSTEFKRNEVLLQSTSWRITGPLRAMVKLFK